jgi:hypothetical protein
MEREGGRERNGEGCKERLVGRGKYGELRKEIEGGRGR